MTSTILLEYPKQMFLPNQYGHFFHGFYFWLLIPCLVLAFKRWPTAMVPLAWFFVIFLTMEFMPHKLTLEGWYSQPRLFRYMSIIVVPTCLLLADSLEWIVSRSRRLGAAVLVPFLILTIVQGYQVTFPSRDAFDDVRQAGKAVRATNPNRIYSDHRMMFHIERFIYQYRRPGITLHFEAENPGDREKEFLAVSDAYVITGGSRLPYYGAAHLTANLGTLPPPEGWRLVWSLDKPPTPWRSEPVRLWKASPSEEVRREIERYHQLDELNDAAMKYFFAGNHLRADPMLRKVVRESRHGELQAEAWYYYGVNLMRLSDPVSALSEFHQWIALFQNHPLEPSIYYHIGLCHNELGEREQALATYRKILSDFHDPGIAGLTQHRLDETLSGYNDGVTIYRFGELERAQREFLRILKEYPDASVTVGSRYFLALIASRESRYQEALRGFTALLRD